MKNTLYLAVMLFAALSFNACKKGDTGPAGAAGANGTNGTNGNANVKSKSMDVHSSDWGSGIGIFGTAGYYYKATIADADITSDIASKGAVLVYFNNNQLPMTHDYPGYTRSTNDSLYTGNVEVRVSDSDGNTPNPGDVTIRVVAISSSARIANPGVENMSYEQVKTLYNLKD